MIQGDSLENRQVTGEALDDRHSRRGRQPLAVPNARVHVTLSPATYDAYDRIARRRGEPLARVIRRALEHRIF